MDDDVLDTSLPNLHHGLDSSSDENTSRLENHDSPTMPGSYPVQCTRQAVVAENQINLLQDMILEMKQGFQSALEELAKIQEKEEMEASHSKKLQQQHQQQLNHLTETVTEIKQQLNSLSKSVETITHEQKTLKGHLEEVSSQHGSFQKNCANKNNGRPGVQTDVSSNIEECNTKLSHLPAEGDDEITVLACRSMSLTQALAEESVKLGISQSSNDDDDDDDDQEEDEEIMRLHNSKNKTTHHAMSRTAYRHHHMSANAGLKELTKDIASAALRQKIVTELADSERNYCSQLWSLLHTYLRPLQTAGFLSDRELDILFPPYLDEIYREHCHICKGIQDKLIHWTHMTTVTDLLVRVTESYSPDSLLSLYKQYTDELPGALAYLRTAKAQSTEFCLLLKAVKDSSCQNEDLMSLLLAPVQRIPKYLLQLQEMFYQTPSTHPDFPHLQTMLHRLHNYVEQLNGDLYNTVHSMNQTRHTRSDFMSGLTPNGRGSRSHHSVISNEDDDITSARAMSKVKRRSHMEWIENPYCDAQGRQLWTVSPERKNTLSQPDLTAYSTMNNEMSDPVIFTHIPRSQSALPAGNGNEVPLRQPVKKFKQMKRNPPPAGYQIKDQISSHSPIVRPSSAVDFFSNSHQNQHYYRLSDDHSRNYQYTSTTSRPKSALGTHGVASSHRPIVISRKVVERSRPKE